MLQKYAAFMDSFPHLIEKGLSAAVYTQTTDVEVETNGFLTYDRKVQKMSVADLKALHEKIYNNPQVKNVR